MKIVHICQFLGIGGLEKVLYSLALEQIKKGHDVKVLVYDKDLRWEQKFLKAGIKVESDYKKKPGYDFGLIRWIGSKLNGAQIVHTHDLNPSLYVAPLRLWKNFASFFSGDSTFSLVHTTHGMEHLEERKRHAFYEAFLGLTAQKIIAVSPKFYAYYRSQKTTARSKVHLIQNGTEIFDTVDKVTKQKMKKRLCEFYGLDPQLPTGVFVGRVSPMKGQLELIKSYQGKKHNLILVGPPTDEAYYESCVSLAVANVALTGAREDIPEILRSCDYFISPSKHEGLPIAALEAAAAGLPCLLSNISGHRQFNQGRPCALLFNGPEDLDALLFKIGADPLSSMRQMAMVFRSRVEADFSSEAMAKKYQSLYQELLC